MTNLNYYFGICKEELRKNTKFLVKIQSSRPAI